MKKTLLINLYLLPCLAFACGGNGTEDVKSQITNMPFKVGGASFGAKTLEIHRTTDGLSLADPDGESIYFNSAGEICLKAPSAAIDDCGAKLKAKIDEITKDSDIVLQKRNQTIGMYQFDFERNQVFVWSVDNEGRRDTKILRYIRITGSKQGDTQGLNVDVMDPATNKQVGSISASRTIAPSKFRCFTLDNPDEYLKGKAHKVDDLSTLNVIYADGKVTSGTYSDQAMKQARGEAAALN